MSNAALSTGKRVVNSRSRRRDHAAYMREYRAKLEIRERPEARVVDRSISAALGLYVANLPSSEGLMVLQAIHELCSAGLENEGYDRRSAAKATSIRLKSLVSVDATNSVRSAAKALAAGKPHSGFRVRHGSRLETP